MPKAIHPDDVRPEFRTSFASFGAISGLLSQK